MKVKILIAGPYSNSANPKKPLRLNAGDLLEFSDDYAESLIKQGLAKSAKEASARPIVPPAKASQTVTKASQTVTKLAKEHDIDLSDIVGTGRDGRIVKADVGKLIQKQETR